MISKKYFFVPSLFLITFTSGVYAQRIFSDVPANHWAAPSIDFVSEHAIMTGPAGKNNMFEPDGIVNRAQMATALTRLHTTMNARIESLELEVARLKMNTQ